jgi:hypothetical protein|nr:MAG TPA: Large subunit terminase [Caudoviricetes sp.]
MSQNANTFDLNKYPTLNAFARSDAFIKFVVGPAGCLPPDSEVLTPDGWVRIDTCPTNIKVIDFNTKESRFEDVVSDRYPASKMYKFDTSYLSMTVSREHKIWYLNGYSDTEYKCITAEELAGIIRREEMPFILIKTDMYEKSYTRHVNLRFATVTEIEPDYEYMYCPHTSTGVFYAKQGEYTFCTGNSAKTSYMAVELFRRACLQEPAADKVRYSRTLVGRNTYQVLKSATIPTFENMLGWLGEAITFKKGSFPPTAHVRARLSDETYVHWDIEFVSFDTEDAVSKLLGYEPTNAMLDEISELPEELIDSVVRRLGRYPSGRKGKPTWVGLIGATNGPRKDHWLYQWSLGSRDKEFAKIEAATGRKQFELFRQPGGLIEKAEGEWVPNPLAENIDNLPGGYGYYFNMLSGDRQRVRAYVEGDFADIVTGKVVYPEFRRDTHVWVGGHEKLPTSLRLYLGFDFGRTPVCTIATATQSGKLIVIDEVMGEDISIDTLCTDFLFPVLRQKYPRSTIDGAWGDPAGNVETQALDVSPFDVLLKHGIPIEDPGGNNKLQPRLEAVKQRLTRLDGEGRPAILITDNCKYIIEAIGSTYIYEKVKGRNDTVRDVPTKSHDGWCSDLCDALSYLCMGYNALVGMKQRRRRVLPSLKRSAM